MPFKNGNIKAYLNKTDNDLPPILDFHNFVLQPFSLDDYKLDGLSYTLLS